jgi:GWxTD domain-containing protein
MAGAFLDGGCLDFLFMAFCLLGFNLPVGPPGVCHAPEPWQQRLARLSARLRLSRPVRLLESCLLEIPVVIGHFRPLVLMPVGLLAGLPPNQIEVILLHELAHIRRCDYLVNSLQRLMEGLLFYNPAIWWISGVIRHEREKCCDDVAVAISGCAYEYAAALIAPEQDRSLRREPAMAVTGGKLMKRIHRLLVPERPTGNWMPLLSTVILVITTTLTLAALQSGPSPAMQPQMSQAKTSPYLKWLDQEVVYIIATEDRAAFLKLATDEERDKFIEQFWSRRDPTPGTPANEFKAEHYRRIALANKRFQTRSGKPGWQTDRGHLYIVYGPPDEIETHPKSAQTTISSESWRYRHLEGMGEDVIISFVDKGQTGDYRLTPESLSKLKSHLPL